LKDAIDYAVSAEAMGNYGRAAMSSSSFNYSRSSSQAATGASSSAPMDLSNINASDEAEDTKELEPAADPMSTLLSKMEAMEHRLNAMFKPGPKNSAGGAAGKKTRVAGLTPDELADCRARGLCFRCKKSGHFKNDPQCKALNH
jgi:hypothetical protein